MEIDQRDLVTVNIMYGSSVKPLKSVAFAQLSAKALFLSKTPLPIDAIAGKVAELIGVKSISTDLIGRGLAYLEELDRARQQNGRWILTREARKEIGKSIAYANDQVAGILKKHFPAAINSRTLRRWFIEASAKLFGHFGDEWVYELSKGGLGGGRLLKGRTLDELLLPTIKQFNLEDAQGMLVEGFIRFLSSEDTSDQQYLMLISQAMFSARLVAADIGVDPITLQELKDSIFLLDTNVLFSIVLEKGRLAAAIESLEGALRTINTRLVYLHTTREEYGRALMGKREEILHLLDIYPDEIIKDLNDDFLVTAQARGCTSRDDYERFFESITDIPKSLPGGYEIKIEDDDKIEAAKTAAEEDNHLKNRIREFSVKYRPRWRGPKGELALNHDAALFHVLRFIRREGSKCWIMSLDRSLQKCSLEQAGPHGVPELISVSAVVEMLSVNNAGPDLDATQFAPLLSRMILNECVPPKDTYISQDLILLHKINEKARELPPEEIRKLAKVVMRARCEGRGAGDVTLALTINRMYQDSVKHVTAELEEARKSAASAKEQAEKERAKSRTLEKELVKSRARDIKRNALGLLVMRIVFWMIVAAGFTWVAFKVYHHYFSGGEVKEIINYVLAVIAFMIPVCWKVPRAVARYREVCAQSVATASKEP